MEEIELNNWERIQCWKLEIQRLYRYWKIKNPFLKIDILEYQP